MSIAKWGVVNVGHYLKAISKNVKDFDPQTAPAITWRTCVPLRAVKTV